jgi:ferredoxin-type protein NapH
LKKRKKPLTAYLAAPLMTITGFFIASLIFTFVFNNPSPVPVFIMFGTIQVICMLLFALLPRRRKRIARMVAMFLIGTFILVLAGMLGRNNFQLEGLFFYLFSGTFGGVIIHFTVGKIAGPVFFSRNWCNWGCWTSMILDLLPYKTDTRWKTGILPKIRHIHFALSVLLVATCYWGLKYSFINTDAEALKQGMGTTQEFIWFISGNILYYVSGIVLAIAFKDNRAFCKYFCPITVFLKAANRFSLLRVAGDKDSCSNCGTCVKHCPMSISIPEYIQQGMRVKSTECILCMNCVAWCPTATLRTSVGIDIATREYLSK